jgi:hypothetical protein
MAVEADDGERTGRCHERRVDERKPCGSSTTTYAIPSLSRRDKVRAR